jgi:hypothetical protein
MDIRQPRHNTVICAIFEIANIFMQLINVIFVENKNDTHILFDISLFVRRVNEIMKCNLYN